MRCCVQVGTKLVGVHVLLCDFDSNDSTQDAAALASGWNAADGARLLVACTDSMPASTPMRIHYVVDEVGHTEVGQCDSRFLSRHAQRYTSVLTHIESR